MIFIGSAGQMAHHPFRVERFPKLSVLGKFSKFFGVKTQTVHSRINMDGCIRRLIDTARHAGPIARLLHGINHGLKLGPKQHALITRGRSVEHINRPVRPNRLAQDFALARCRNKKYTAPRPVERAAYLNRAQTISVSLNSCLLYTSPSPRDRTRSRMPSSA